ncbi:hypothetical protein BD289DRAFT_210828 [Coniella lustricola]|uniref:Uncharacterized protein n=1 Tax=Coniella lustricola TaxID=2025994 RepID=A0A2T3ABW2_9PEZI|nr:hypothetical protein BD289DRAFT_210828 [Coniella lustricola]
MKLSHILSSFMLAVPSLVNLIAASLVPKDIVGTGPINGGYVLPSGPASTAFSGDNDLDAFGISAQPVTSTVSSGRGDRVVTTVAPLKSNFTATWTPITITYTSVQTSVMEPSTETAVRSAVTKFEGTTTETEMIGGHVTTFTIVIVTSYSTETIYTTTFVAPSVPVTVLRSWVRTTTSEKLVTQTLSTVSTEIVSLTLKESQTAILIEQPLGAEDMNTTINSSTSTQATISNFTISFFKSAPPVTGFPSIPLGHHYPNVTTVSYSDSALVTAHGYNFSSVSTTPINVTTVTIEGNKSYSYPLPLFKNTTAVIGGGLGVLSAQAVPTGEILSLSSATIGGFEETLTFNGLCKHTTTVTILTTQEVQNSNGYGNGSDNPSTTYRTSTNRLSGTLTRGRTMTSTLTVYLSGAATANHGGDVPSATATAGSGTASIKSGFGASNMVYFAIYHLTVLFIVGLMPLI